MSHHGHYVRPDRPNGVPSGDWTPQHIPRSSRWDDVNPAARWAIVIGIVLLVTALIVIASIYAGDAAVDGFGPLIPSPTPYPEGWTP